jgi:hypothetical protein
MLHVCFVRAIYFYADIFADIFADIRNISHHKNWSEIYHTPVLLHPGPALIYF